MLNVRVREYKQAIYSAKKTRCFNRLFALFHVSLALKNSAKKTCCLIDFFRTIFTFSVRVRIKNSAKKKCFWCKKAIFIKIVRLRNTNSANKKQK